jgi:hypothetical protein
MADANLPKQQLELFAEPPSPETLAALAQRVTGIPMKWPVNHITLAGWVQKYGEPVVREELENYCLWYLLPTPHRFLAQWEWQLFAPADEILTGLGVVDDDDLIRIRREWREKNPNRPRPRRKRT